MGYILLLLMVALTVYSQIVIKWQVSLAGQFPELLDDRIWFLLKLTFSPWVMSALLAVFLAFLSWVVALTKIELTRAYPVSTLAFVLVMASGSFLFGETISFLKIVGMSLVVLGIIIGAQG